MEWRKALLCQSGECVEVAWHKASFSSNGADCVEASFHKASFSESGQCVECGRGDGNVLVRDSKHRDGTVLEFTPAEWKAFLAGVKAGEFDSLVE